MTAKRAQAERFIAEAQAIGCTPSLKGDWVVWQPPLPTEMLMRSMPINNEIAAILQEVDA